jgi:hypothetical protein
MAAQLFPLEEVLGNMPLNTKDKVYFAVVRALNRGLDFDNVERRVRDDNNSNAYLQEDLMTFSLRVKHYFEDHPDRNKNGHLQIQDLNTNKFVTADSNRGFLAYNRIDRQGFRFRSRGRVPKSRGRVAKSRGRVAKSRSRVAKSRGRVAKSRSRVAKSRSRVAKSRSRRSHK